MSNECRSVDKLSRRRALTLAATASGGLLAATRGASAIPPPRPPLGHRSRAPLVHIEDSGLPVDQIEEIMQAPGNVSESGVLSIEIDRNDIPDVTRHDIPILPSFEINGTAYFQALGDGRAILNGDFALLPKEIDPFIDALIRNGLVFQAFHMHFYDLTPMIWFMHYRGIGDPLQLAQATFNSIRQATATPFPQSPPSQSTPLPAEEIGRIIGGSVQIGDNGVVNVSVPRADKIELGGVPIAGDEGVDLTVAFEPLDNGQAVGAPDFSMTSKEVMPVMVVMRKQGWDVNCLYNQETDEFPQLFFSHQLKIGDPLQLAKEIRNGANETNLSFSS